MLTVADSADVKEYEFFVIEDDPDHQLIAKMALESAGIDRVTCFSTGEEAIAFFEQIDPNPSRTEKVILIDLMLPAIGGLEILQRLRHDKRWGSSTMVVLTCSTSSEDRARSEQYGADRFLSKPLHGDRVREILASLG
jgi:sigma-B regulation protein RsbU (phosphoserine phosphatase)